MEKILLAMEGDKQNTYAVDFACFLAKLTGSQLTGIFLEGSLDTAVENRTIDVGNGQQATLMVERVSQAIRRFRETCACRGVICRVHRDRGLPLSEVLLESRFSD